MSADPPTLGRAFALATEQQGQQLVTEADTQQFVAALIALQQERLQGFDPGVGTERVRLAACHQVRIELQVLGRVVAVHHVVDAEAGSNGLAGEELLEHAAITLILVNQFRPQDIGFENADA
ncbi:hypothetical protein D3C81_1274000 [compost metagenome]